MSSGNARIYAPDDINLTIGTQPISGFQKGTFVEADRYKEQAAMDVGSDGEVTMTVSPDQSGYIKFTLQQSSPSNDYLHSLRIALQNKILGTAIVPCLMKDNNGSSLVRTKQAWVKKGAKVEFADTSEGREWTMDTGFLDIQPGGENTLS